MATIPLPEDDRWPLADALARVVAAREALVDGDISYAAAILEDLEHDLAGWLVEHEERRAA